MPICRSILVAGLSWAGLQWFMIPVAGCHDFPLMASTSTIRLMLVKLVCSVSLHSFGLNYIVLGQPDNWIISPCAKYFAPIALPSINLFSHTYQFFLSQRNWSWPLRHSHTRTIISLRGVGHEIQNNWKKGRIHILAWSSSLILGVVFNIVTLKQP